METCSLAVFLGSGGHTTEALALVSSLDFARYTPRTYIISQGDHLSAHKASSLESFKDHSSATSTGKFAIVTIPRARRVHQSFLTTPLTTVVSLLKCIYLVTFAPLVRSSKAISADVLLVNGPGTCFILCIAVCLNKFLRLSTSQIIYIESFARVRNLSVSGKLLRPLVDRFIVQWPQVLREGGRGEFRGWLV